MVFHIHLMDGQERHCRYWVQSVMLWNERRRSDGWQESTRFKLKIGHRTRAPGTQQRRKPGNRPDFRAPRACSGPLQV